MSHQKSLSAVDNRGRGDPPPWGGFGSIGGQPGDPCQPAQARKPAQATCMDGLARKRVERHCITTKRSAPARRGLHGVDRHCATRPGGAVLARLVSDYGDPLRSRYEPVDYESTCIDCSKHATRP
jgi:hypothetical protein